MLGSRSSDYAQLHNRLWQARKRVRLGQKQVAFLLRHHTSDQVSRFEKGLRLPNLETALRLEIIFGCPVRLLFPDIYALLRSEIEARAKNNVSLKAISDRWLASDEFGNHCTHGEQLLSPKLLGEERDTVRRHVTELARRLANLP